MRDEGDGTSFEILTNLTKRWWDREGKKGKGHKSSQPLYERVLREEGPLGSISPREFSLGG